MIVREVFPSGPFHERQKVVPTPGSFLSRPRSFLSTEVSKLATKVVQYGISIL